MRNASGPRMARGAYSVRKIAAPTAIGVASKIAMAVVTSVPKRYAPAPNAA